MLKRRNLLLFSILLLSNLALAKVKIEQKAVPQKLSTLTFLPESQVTLSGDSTVRKFNARGSNLNLSAHAASKPAVAVNLPWTPVDLKMVFPAKNLKSDSSTLDDHMYEALKTEKFPEIELQISKFDFSSSADHKNVTATGTLTIAGVSKTVALSGVLTIEGQNLRVKGAKKMLMSDFGVVPPTLMLGALKVSDEIEINFDVLCLLEIKN